jgi:hypothetical protein
VSLTILAFVMCRVYPILATPGTLRFTRSEAPPKEMKCEKSFEKGGSALRRMEELVVIPCDVIDKVCDTVYDCLGGW